MRDGVVVDVSARYLDALTLLTRNAGKLVSKDQFFEEVWRGIPVTDEALTQCIKTLRRLLGDDAANPHFIETVQKHGYRFIAPVQPINVEPLKTANPQALSVPPVIETGTVRNALILAGAGTIGAGIAGFAGGLLYGLIGASQPLAPGTGAASVLLVVLWFCVAVAITGGAGVSLGIAAAMLAPTRRWMVAGGALGGMAVGGAVKLLGLDAFSLLLGRAPNEITGAPEGALIGAAVGLAVLLVGRETTHVGRSVALAGLVGGVAGLFITFCGGRMMGGSLALLADTFPQSRLRLSPLSHFLGEPGFGTLSQVLTGGLEGALFTSCIAAAMAIARRGLGSKPNQRLESAGVR